MSDRPELGALTGARGLAAWLVVLYHLRTAADWLPPGIERALAHGYMAVDFFFLLSGFVIWLSWHQRFSARGWAEVPRFLQKRIARVWPLHLAMLGFGVALASLLAATGRADPGQYPFADLPLHVAMMQDWGFTNALTWNDPAWSISAEFAAYLLFPLLAIAVDWRRLPAWGVIAVIAALFGALHAVLATGGSPTLGTDISRFGLVRCLFEFAAGTGVAALWLRARPMPAILLSGTVALVLGAGVASGIVPQTLGVPPALAALLLLLALTSGWRGNPLSSRPMHYLGEISYATYLGHYLPWFAFKLLFVRDAYAVPQVQMAAYLALVLLASIALYHLVERPAQRAVNGLRIMRQPILRSG